MPAHISGAASSWVQILGHRCYPDGWSEHVIRISAVKGNASGQKLHLAAEEITTATCIAVATVPGMPPHTHALALFPPRDTFPDSINHADNLVAWHSWILQTLRVTLLHHGITVADPTSLDSNSHPAGAGFRNLTLYDLEWSARTGNLCSTHLWHKQFRVRGEDSRLDAGIPRAGRSSQSTIAAEDEMRQAQTGAKRWINAAPGNRVIDTRT